MSNHFQKWIIRSGLAALAWFCAGNPALAQSTDLNRASMLAEMAFEYARAARPRRAVSLLEQAETQVDADCYEANALLKIGVGYLEAGQSVEGEQFLSQAFETAYEHTQENCHSGAASPEKSLFNHAVEYAEAGHFDLALKIAEGFVDGWMDPIAMAEIAAYYQAADQQRQAKRVLTQAIAIAQDYPADSISNQLLILMANKLIQAEHDDLAEFVIDQTGLGQPQALDASQNPDSALFDHYQTLLLAQILADLDQSQPALTLLDSTVSKIQPSTDFPLKEPFHLIESALLYNALGHTRQAAELLEKVKTHLQQAPDQLPAKVRLVEGYAALGQFDQARALAKSIQGASDRQRAYGAIAAEYIKVGSTEEAASLAQSIGAPEAVERDMIRAYLETEQYSRAQQLAQQANLPDMVSEIAQAYLKGGQPEQALQLIDSISTVNVADRLRLLTAIEFAQRNQLDQALDLAQTIAVPEAKVEALTAIAADYIDTPADSLWGRLWARLMRSLQAWLGTSDQEKAIEILDQALDILQSEPNSTEKSIKL